MPKTPLKPLLDLRTLLSAAKCNDCRKDLPATSFQVAQMLIAAVEALRLAQPLPAPDYVRVVDLAHLLSLPSPSAASRLLDCALAHGRVRSIPVSDHPNANLRYHYGDVLAALQVAKDKAKDARCV